VVEEHVGGRRRCSMGKWTRQEKKKAVGSTLRRFPTKDGASGSWSAWRGSEAHEGGAQWSVFGAWSRGARREAEQSGVETWRLPRERRKTGSRRDRYCARWRAVDSGGARWQEVTEPLRCHHVRVGACWPETQPWAVVGHWQAGPVIFLIFSRFSNTHNLIFQLVIFLMSKFLQIFQVDCLRHKEQLLFLDQLQNPK
jgi:hypothetical protein